jgi:hypothetical protein
VLTNYFNKVRKIKLLVQGCFSPVSRIGEVLLFVRKVLHQAARDVIFDGSAESEFGFPEK